MKLSLQHPSYSKLANNVTEYVPENTTRPMTLFDPDLNLHEIRIMH